MSALKERLILAAIPVALSALGFTATGYLRFREDVAELRATVRYLERVLDNHVATCRGVP